MVEHNLSQLSRFGTSSPHFLTDEGVFTEHTHPNSPPGLMTTAAPSTGTFENRQVEHHQAGDIAGRNAGLLERIAVKFQNFCEAISAIVEEGAAILCRKFAQLFSGEPQDYLGRETNVSIMAPLLMEDTSDDYALVPPDYDDESDTESDENLGFTPSNDSTIDDTPVEF